MSGGSNQYRPFLCAFRYNRRMRSSDLLLTGRRRAGLSQDQLAERLGRPQSTIARWETGQQHPPLESVIEALHACDLELTVGLARYDDSHQSLIARQLLLEPVERVKLHVVPADASMRRVELAARRLGGEGAEVGSDGSRCWCCPGGGVACAGICSPLSSASLRGSPWGRATGTIAQVVDMSSCGYRDAAPRAHRRYKNS